MEELISKGKKLFTKTILINILCIFLVLALSMVMSFLYTKSVGYKAMGKLEGETTATELYTYYYADGEDTKKQEYIDKGYTITESPIYSKISPSLKNTFLIIAQVVAILITLPFVYNYSWALGTNDSALVKSGSIKKDTLKGFKIGLVSAVPQFLFLVLIIIMPTFADFYKLLNAYSYSIIEWIYGGAKISEGLSILQIALLFVSLFIIPVISGFCYILGLNNYSVSEKFLYKKGR